jgi:hypothetical protein
VRTWPQKGPKTLSYTNKINRKTEEYEIDNWILVDATLYSDNDIEDFIAPQNTFDFEMYKVLAKYL